ncbi:MAG TPA: aldo/keto reductase [Tepidisphaeraceae bacterium]|nr:aldo/keto reductase [Tepidisphaeraceae bacterium]
MTQYRILGRTGVKVSPLCLGTMNFGGRTDSAESFRILDQYVETGGNFVDTANVYNDGRSEEVIGDWMKQRGVRDRIVLSTKVHGRRSPHVNDAGNHRWHIVREVEQSLRRLKTERIDLYHIHRPDSDTPIDQTLRALDDLIRQGKVLYLASSVFSAWQLAEAHFIAEKLGTARFDVEQPQLNIIDRRIEADVLPFCRKYEIATITWAPLARGRLAGVYTHGGRKIPDGSWYKAQNKTDFPQSQWPVMEGVDKLADARGISSSQFAIAWCLQVPGVTCPIIGPRTLDQVKDNLAAQSITLSAEELKAVDALNPPGELCRDRNLGPVPR